MMWRKLTLVLAAILTITSLVMGDTALAQSNAGSGNQGTISNRPRIDIIQNNITEYRVEKNTFITANADKLNEMAGDINESIDLLWEAINNFAGRPETDPYVASFADKRLQPGNRCFGGCAANQKMHWDGSNWRCLSAVLPTCPSGQIFSATTCSCADLCSNPGDVPDNNGVCCEPGQIIAGACTACPAGSSWSNGSCRCDASGSPVPLGSICCPDGATPNGTNSACVCTIDGTEVPSNGTCNPGTNCPVPGQTRDGHGICCAPGDRNPPLTGYCSFDPQLCPTGTTYIPGVNHCQCPGPGNILIGPNETCPCPSGTVPGPSGSQQCECPSGALINYGGTCPVCPVAGQVPDNNGTCCLFDEIENGVCVVSGLSCAATSISNCDLPQHPIAPNQSQVVNGTCTENYVPATGGSCNGTCEATVNASNQNVANYTLNVGCVLNSCPAGQVQLTCGGQPTCKPECAIAGETWNAACSSCECAAPKSRRLINGVEQCVDGCPAGTEAWNAPSGPVQCLTPCGPDKERNGSGECVCNSNRPHEYAGRCNACIEPGQTSLIGCGGLMPAHPECSQAVGCNTSIPNIITCQCEYRPWDIGNNMCGGGLEIVGGGCYTCNENTGEWNRCQ